MPAQELAPWDELLDAQMEAADAVRSDDLERMRAAAGRLDDARERMGCVGGLLLLAALTDGGLAVQRKLAAVFGAKCRSAADRATAAEERASWAVAQVDALTQRVRELEERLAARTPGIGEPGRTN